MHYKLPCVRPTKEVRVVAAVETVMAEIEVDVLATDVVLRII